MHKNGIFYALICINNRIFACSDCMLSAFDGPTGIVGPSKIGGRTRPMRATQRLKDILSFICDSLASLSLCGTMFSFFLRRTRGGAWRVRSIRANQCTLIWWISVRQININTCD